ncbi:MAG: hypothetical protein A2X12_08210 [Bacteroidetes bacterium GWE2_29_8]|nr:MAG: hypothetical protein A2X12_08210 [Bacteroidetes bacterium GWE2_29_8]OFY15655.1 MAG: hypothetical protein A2X02_06475 [Bacteroidetes bacterium GWF2_29_10]
MTKLKQVVEKEIFFSEKTGKTFIIGGFFFIIIVIIIFLIFGNWSFSTILDEEKVAQFGDFIGGIIGSLFSLAGVILFYVALKEQRKDININQENLKIQNTALHQQVEEFKAQKTELIETRKVYEEQTLLFREQTSLYKQQTKDLKEQTYTAKLQQFDSSFFSYLNVFIELKNTLNIKKTNYFGDIYKSISEVNIEEQTLVASIELIQAKYVEVFHNNKSELSHYFKTLYRIIMLIDSSSLDEDKKQQYFKLLRSQLSDDELLILYYNYHTQLGVKVRPYVVKYDILKHISILDKIEIGSDLNVDVKYEFEDFLSEIGAYIIKGFNKFSSIEVADDVDFSTNSKILGIEVWIELKIISEFQFILKFIKNDLEDHETLTKERIKKLISRQIYSVLFLNKFKLPEEDQIIISTIDCPPNLEFNFKIKNIQNI